MELLFLVVSLAIDYVFLVTHTVERVIRMTSLPIYLLPATLVRVWWAPTK